jgi:hypothetical protein
VSTTENINIVSTIGNNICVAPEDGEKVYQKIREALREDKNVKISFKGIEDLTTLFLNIAIGQLYKEFEDDEVKRRLSVTDASPQDLETLIRCVKRAKEYRKDSERFHSAANEILGEDNESD